MLDLRQVKPLAGKLLVKLLPLYSSGASPHGLTLIDQKHHWDHKTRRAEVVSVGRNVIEMVPGDVVLFAGGAGKFVDDPSQVGYQREAAYLAIDEEDVMAIFEREDKAA